MNSLLVFFVTYHIHRIQVKKILDGISVSAAEEEAHPWP
jgi:hypothetical protein